jgi:hypothetical protein
MFNTNAKRIAWSGKVFLARGKVGTALKAITNLIERIFIAVGKYSRQRRHPLLMTSAIATLWTADGRSTEDELR